MKLQVFSLGVASLVAASLFSLPAHANIRGIAGRSGKQGPTCMAAGCHATSASPSAPTVQITGPSTLEAGTTGNYTLVIKGGPAVKAGMNVATSAGSLTAGTDTKILQNAGENELTHKDVPKNFDGNGEARFDFSLVAPSSAGTVTLYASGNSTNGNNANTGDNSVTTTLSVTVTGSSGNPDAGTGEPDAGTDPGGGKEEEDKGCSATGGAPMVLLLAIAAAYLRRRTV